MTNLSVATAGSTDFTATVRYLEAVYVGSLDPLTSVRVSIKDTDTNGTSWFTIGCVGGGSEAFVMPHPVLITGGVYVSIVDAVTGAAVASKARVTIVGY